MEEADDRIFPTEEATRGSRRKGCHPKADREDEGTTLSNDLKDLGEGSHLFRARPLPGELRTPEEDKPIHDSAADLCERDRTINRGKPDARSLGASIVATMLNNNLCPACRQ